MSISVVTANVAGLLTKEWRGASIRAYKFCLAGMLTLVVAIIVISLAQSRQAMSRERQNFVLTGIWLERPPPRRLETEYQLHFLLRREPPDRMAGRLSLD